MRKLAYTVPLLLALLIPGGCEEDTGTLPGNQPPRTYLSIVGSELATTDYRKILHWWGTDPDGEVRGYLIRWDGLWTPDPGTEQVYQGLDYSYTTANADTFPVALDGSFAVRTFTVRSIDDQGLVDPGGVSQAFPLRNSQPSLAWNPAVPLPTRSLPAVAFGWNPTDSDGRSTVRTFRIWLDGDSANIKTVSDTVVALFPEDFGDRIDTERTVYVQAFDEARAASDTISHRWHVESPQGDWLLIDQLTGPGTSTWDRPFFSAVLDSVVGGDIHPFDLADGPDFVTEEEVEPLFTLFRGVIWVTGPYSESNERKMARNLATAEKGIAAYVEGGGRIVIAGQSSIGYRGGLGSDFAGEVLNIPGYYEIRIEPEGTRVTDLPLNRDERVYFERGGAVDSLIVYSTATRVDYFRAPALPGLGLYRVAPGALKRMSGSTPIPDQSADPAYLGVIAEHGSGKICLITTSYARLFPRPSEGDPTWPDGIHEAIVLFRETLSP